MTDTEYLLSELEKGPRDAMQVISASLRDRGVGLTVHSRVADLRAQGFTISCSVEGETRKGRPRWVYRLVSEPAESGRNVDAGALRPEPQANTPGMPPVSPRPDETGVEPLEQMSLA